MSSFVDLVVNSIRTYVRSFLYIGKIPTWLTMGGKFAHMPLYSVASALVVSVLWSDYSYVLLLIRPFQLEPGVTKNFIPHESLLILPRSFPRTTHASPIGRLLEKGRVTGLAEANADEIDSPVFKLIPLSISVIALVVVLWCSCGVLVFYFPADWNTCKRQQQTRWKKNNSSRRNSWRQQSRTWSNSRTQTTG